MKLRNPSASAALFLAAAVSLSACSAGNQGAAEDQNRAGGNAQVRVQQTVPQPDRDQDNAAVTQRLTALAKSVPDVKDANCVVFGNTAIVGINVAGSLDRSRVGTIKYAVAEALRKDPDGMNAIVTADMDLNSRIQEISADIQNGRPLAGFAEELADIVGRIIPQLPRDAGGREDVAPTPGATTEDGGAAKAENPSQGPMEPGQTPYGKAGNGNANGNAR